MRKYIQNLTDTLIGKHRFDLVAFRIDIVGSKRDRDNFLDHVSDTLVARDVRAMNSETLGKILCSLEVGDVIVGKKELFERLNFSGDCEETLREFVAIALAYVIRDRLHPVVSLVAPYKGIGRKQ